MKWFNISIFLDYSLIRYAFKHSKTDFIFAKACQDLWVVAFYKNKLTPPPPSLKTKTNKQTNKQRKQNKTKQK